MLGLFDESRIYQLLVSYACKYRPVKELGPSSAKAIQSSLERCWGELFENPLSPQELETTVPQGGEPKTRALLGLNKTVFLPQGSATINSFVLRVDNHVTCVPRKIAGQPVGILNHDLWLKEKEANTKAREIANAVSAPECLGLAVHRTGKLYELQFGPYDPDEMNQIRTRISPFEQTNIGAINTAINFIKKSGKGRTYNFNMVLTVPEVQSGPQIVVVKLDINNRNMSSSLDPHEFTEIWDYADSSMPEWLLQNLGDANE